MIKHRFISLAIMSATIMLPTFAQKKVVQDTVPNTKEVKNRNVMLNASADNQPRQISIGLPAEMSATIYEDGTPVSWTWWPMLPYFYWAQSPMYGRMGLTNLSENAITNGSVNYSVDSWSREGSDQFNGFADYTTNTFGLQRFDVALSGPIKNGWSYSVGAYANLDRGSNKLADTELQGNMKQYKAGLTKQFANNKGKISLFYKYNYFKGLSDNNAPFIYVGDGSVKEYEGFKMGRDGFLPANGQITYMDVETGNMETIQRTSGTSALSNDVNLVLDYNFKPNLTLKFLSKYHYANTHYVGLSMAGIGRADVADNYTYAYDMDSHKAGEAFTGNYTSRYLQRIIGNERTWYNTLELKGKNKDHNWRLGYNLWWIMPSAKTSTGLLAHTVEKDPVWLNHNGSQVNIPNTGAEYYDTHEIKTALYASDEWQATDRLWLSAGLRLEYYKVAGNTLLAYMDVNDTEATYPENIPTIGFSMKDASKVRISENWINPAAQINARYTIASGFGVLAEGVFAATAPGSPNFVGPNMPNLDPINTYYGSAGLFWNTKWMKLVSQVSYIKKTNYQRRLQFTNPNDASDLVTLPTTYSIQTLGWTTDVVLTPFKGFNIHGLLTIQSPKFKDFDFTAVFNDGSSSVHNFTDKVTTGVSKVLIELDPSYSFDKFRIWASFRYQSKQYVNKTNTLYFNGRWETFAGVDYVLNKNVSFGVNMVNLLNQKGASGSISSADLVEDVSQYQNFLMAGNYIRPFTVEFSTRIKF